MTESASALTAENLTPDNTRDAAWAAVNVPLTPEQLSAFCHEDVERLFRINPYLEFDAWDIQNDGRIHFTGRNSSQGTAFSFDLILSVTKHQDGLSVRYESGLKQDTLFKVEASEFGARLTIHENYHSLTDAELETRQHEIDRSLTTWAADLQKYLIMWKQWRWLGPWRWYMDRIWKRLKPSGRRITYMFWWITLVEIALIALGVAIYLAEYA